MRSICRKFAVSYTRNNLSSRPGCPVATTAGIRIVCWAVAIWMTACSGPDRSSETDAVLIRSEGQTITLAQFERAFEAARIAYSDSRAVDPATIEEARLRLLDQMAEELIVDRRARELEIALDENELETAIQEIKKDYPADEFNQMLLESAIPFALWKDRLRVRLLMEKVVERDLGQPLTITAGDIEAYYKAHAQEFSPDDQSGVEMDLNRAIVDQLRREKVEAAYPGWMDGLRQRLGVEINWELWDRTHRPDAESAGREKG
ncbi:MAG: SurA N-terminal domain-containing protein [Desulfosarcina sp.]